jgi:hypothetical protein
MTGSTPFSIEAEELLDQWEMIDTALAIAAIEKDEVLRFRLREMRSQPNFV